MTQVKIKYVNDPKPGGSGKFGSLKDFDGVTYMVPAALLRHFTAGTVVDVEVKAETWGTSQMNVVQGAPAGPATNGTNPVRLTPEETGRVIGLANRYPNTAAAVQSPQVVADIGLAMPSRNNSADRMIFITGVTGRAMGSGSFTPEHIRIIARAAADAYDELHR